MRHHGNRVLIRRVSGPQPEQHDRAFDRERRWLLTRNSETVGEPPIAIRARGLAKDYDHRPVLKSIDLDVKSGESLLLRGSNGAGKTTLLRCLASSVRPTAGAVWWFGHRVADDPSLRRLIGVVAHESRLYPQLTLRENLLLAARLYAVDEPGRQADRLLDETGMAAHANRRPADVSRGMRQRVSVARTLIHQPRILLLDEPFSGLDLAGRGWLRQQLATLRQQGRTLCVVTHDEAVADGLWDRAVLLQDGRLREAGSLPAAAEWMGERQAVGEGAAA